MHGTNTNKNCFKALIAAEYSGVHVELVKNFEMGVSNKTPEYLKMNPIGKVCSKSPNKDPYYNNLLLYLSDGEKWFMIIQVPVLETPDGPIFESNAIARYGMEGSYTVMLYLLRNPIL